MSQPLLATRRELLETLAIDPDLLRRTHRRFPVQWPKPYLTLAAQHEAIAALGRPTEDELMADPGDIPDAIGDRAQRPHPFIVRKHRNRVIVLATKRCHFYCRFCFRREEPVIRAGELNDDDWLGVFDYLRANPDIEEPILSGGDPLTLSDERLAWIRDQIRTIPSVRRWRIHTRAPVHHPARITDDLVRMLADSPPLRVVTHYNHAAEITDESVRIAELMQAGGIEYKNQTVLLAGVNATIDDQVALWRGMSELGLAPHHLHHPDRVAGNRRFRVTIGEGLSIYHGLLEQFPQAPDYVLDLPDGRGKVPVTELVHANTQTYTFTHDDGHVSTYHDWA